MTVIPVFDSTKPWNKPQNIQAYIWRALEVSRLKEHEWKYKFIKWFKKSSEVFGMNILLENLWLVKNYWIIITEGFNDVLSLYDKWKKNTVSLMGRTMSKKQEELLSGTWTTKFTLFLDKNQYTYGDKEHDWVYQILAWQLFLKLLN